MAAVKKAKLNLKQAEAAYANYPESKFLDPFLSEIHEPERISELAQLKERKVAAEECFGGSYCSSGCCQVCTRQQRRYQHSLEMSRYQTNLQRQQYQLASLVNQLQEVESKLEEIVAVRSPYSGRVRRVKILGQNDRLITAEVTRGYQTAVKKLIIADMPYLSEQLVTAGIKKAESVRELLQVTGYESVSSEE